MERLQKIIASSGYCSRRKAEELIEKGLVFVDGKLAKIGDKCKISSEIKINGEIISVDNEKCYYVLNKPKGILVTRDDPQKRKTIYDLTAVKKLEEKFGRLNYIGRLDGMSEGLLVLTNDGEFQNELTHPSKHVEKIYKVRTEPKLREKDVERLEKGLMIDERKFFAKIFNKSKNEFDIIIKEGRNRIIRKSMDKLGYKIFMLKRIGIGKLNLEDLKIGEVREIKKEDVLS